MQNDFFGHTHTTTSDQETHQLGVSFSSHLPVNSVIAFFGDLGAGKTTFIRGVVDGLGSNEVKNVCSPTFNFLNIYTGQKPIYHFDLYRLPRMEEFFAAGFDEYFTAGGICCIEWAEKIQSALPGDTIVVKMSYVGENGRQICMQKGLP